MYYLLVLTYVQVTVYIKISLVCIFEACLTVIMQTYIAFAVKMNFVVMLLLITKLILLVLNGGVKFNSLDCLEFYLL